VAAWCARPVRESQPASVSSTETKNPELPTRGAANDFVGVTIEKPFVGVTIEERIVRVTTENMLCESLAFYGI